MSWPMSSSERERVRSDILSKLSSRHGSVSDSKLREKTREFESEAYNNSSSRSDYDRRIKDKVRDMSSASRSRCPFLRS